MSFFIIAEANMNMEIILKSWQMPVSLQSLQRIPNDKHCYMSYLRAKNNTTATTEFKSSQYKVILLGALHPVFRLFFDIVHGTAICIIRQQATGKQKSLILFHGNKTLSLTYSHHYSLSAIRSINMQPYNLQLS